jgi:hypothetical protein
MTTPITILRIDVHHYFESEGGLSQHFADLRRLIVSSKDEVVAALTEVKATITDVGTQLDKATTEILAKIAVLENADLPPEIVTLVADVKTAVAPLKVLSQKLDDIDPSA